MILFVHLYYGYGKGLMYLCSALPCTHFIVVRVLSPYNSCDHCGFFMFNRQQTCPCLYCWLLGDASCANSGVPVFSCGTSDAFLFLKNSPPPCSTWKVFFAMLKVKEVKFWWITFYPSNSDFDHWLKTCQHSTVIVR